MNLEKYTGADGQERELNLYYPENWTKDDKRGLVIFFFGGGWTKGTVRQFEPQARELARLGMVVARPAYRVLSRDGTTLDAAVQDAVYSVSHMYEHAAEYGVDPEKIVLGGGSAGAHLAISALLLKRFIPETARYREHIRGLLLCNPVLDVVAQKDQFPAVYQSPCAAEDLSPMHNLWEKMPDTLIFHGTADTTVPFENSRIFTRKAKALGNHVELIPFEGYNHGFFNIRAAHVKPYYEVLGHMVDFLYARKFFEV